MISIYVATNVKSVIGKVDGGMPWSIPEEMAFFKRQTMGKPCIMGHTTWLTIPEKYRPLPGRMNIVVSRSRRQLPGAYFSFSVEKAISLAQTLQPTKEVCIIGGSQIYQYCLENNLVNRVVQSVIHINDYDAPDAIRFNDEVCSNWSRELIFSGKSFDVYLRNNPSALL